MERRTKEKGKVEEEESVGRGKPQDILEGKRPKHEGSFVNSNDCQAGQVMECLLG